MRKLLLCLLALCLLAGCAAPAAQETPADVPAVPDAPEAPAAPVLVCGDDVLDADAFQYYFGHQYAAVLDAYGSSAFDPKQPLEDQDYDGTRTWADFMTEQAMNLAEQTRQLCLAAKKAGFALPEGAELNAVTDEAAKKEGYAGLDDYLTAYYGEGADPEGYRAFLTDMATAAAYSEQLLNARTYTDEEIERFYDERATDYAEIFKLPKNYDCPLDVRIIRFYPDDPGSQDDWQAAEQRANRVADQFRADESDAAFAALADAHTEDFNCPGGGLYPQVHPGQYPALDGWLFAKDSRRAPGDYELLREDDAWALCYVSAVAERPYWMTVAENDLRYADYFAAFETLKKEYVFERHPENVNLRVPTAHNAKKELPEGIEAVG